MSPGCSQSCVRMRISGVSGEIDNRTERSLGGGIVEVWKGRKAVAERRMEWKWRRGLSFRLVDKLLGKSWMGIRLAVKMLALIFWREGAFILGCKKLERVWKAEGRGREREKSGEERNILSISTTFSFLSFPIDFNSEIMNNAFNSNDQIKFLTMAEKNRRENRIFYFC